MSEPDEIKLWCWVLGDTPDQAFTVSSKLSASIHDLKKAIHGQKPSFKDITPDSLEVYKFQLPLENFNEDCAQSIKLEDSQRLKTWNDISFYWTKDPGKVMSIILSRPVGTTITPSSFQNANPSLNSPPSWLDEMHGKLWGKRELFGEIFRTATLTKADFIELQLELEGIDSSRSSPSYTAREVLKVKANFLRKKSDPMKFNNLDPRLLVPSVYRSPVPDDAMNIDTNTKADPMPQFDNHRYIFDDAAELCMGSAAVFPCTIQYMDLLTTLELKDLSHVPRLMLIRGEWDMMIKMFNGRKGGIGGSAVFTGSPGIGKTCFLYYILILCLIRSQTVVFQDKNRDVFLITKTVLPQTREVAVEGNDILTLVDADGDFCIPYKYILRSNLRILLTSSPRSRKDRKWLIQDVRDPDAAYVMSPWLQEEWLVASLFLADKDITLQRFWETAHISGFVPRDFLNAVKSPVALKDARMKILEAIKTCQDIKEAISGVAEDLRFPHRAFVIYPGDQHRSLVGCLVEPISEYAMDTIIKVLDDRSADAAFNLYQSIQDSHHAATFRGRIWERKVHWYFRQTFTIRSLDDSSARRTVPSEPFITRSLDDNSKRKWDLSKVPMKHFDFGPLQMLAGELTERVAARESIYLQSTSDNFASLDSIIYQPPDPLVCIQITIASTHPIETKGLSALQRSLKPLLSPLLPTVEKPWTLLFVVPKPMENSFEKQYITGAGNAGWSEKTKQYVLGLDQHEVFYA